MSVKKIPRRISSGESFGSSIHNTLRRWGELEMLRQAKTPIKNQLKLFTEHEDEKTGERPLELTTLLTMFRECFISEGYGNRAAMDEALLRGEKVLQRFFEWWKQEERTVLTIESGFKLNIERENTEPLMLSGRFDRIERTTSGLHIIDYKTSEPRTQENIDTDLQLSIYALAATQEWHEPIDRLSLLFLGEEETTELSTMRSDSEIRDAVSTIRLLNDGIASKDFTATPTREKCRYCPYRERCPSALR